MEDILRKNKKIRHNGTKMCKVCGRELLINEFPLKGGRICKECKNKKNRDLTAQKRIEQYLSDESMHFKRKYKKIDSSRILRKNESGIDLIARDERFVKLLYYKDTWYSSHGRVVEYRDGKYRVQRVSKDKRTGKRMFTLEKEKYVKPTKIFKYVKHRVSAEELAVETFIVNYDKTNNTRIWHQLNNENDLYYKNLYPVTEKQYNRLTELQEESVFPLSEDLIMQVINAVEYKQDGWNPAHYRRGMCGIGYSGMAVGTEGYHEKSYTKWKDMMQINACVKSGRIMRISSFGMTSIMCLEIELI